MKSETLCDVYCEVPWIALCHSIGQAKRSLTWSWSNDFAVSCLESDSRVWSNFMHSSLTAVRSCIIFSCKTSIMELTFWRWKVFRLAFLDLPMSPSFLPSPPEEILLTECFTLLTPVRFPMILSFVGWGVWRSTRSFEIFYESSPPPRTHHQKEVASGKCSSWKC